MKKKYIRPEMDIIEFEDYALKNLSAFITVGYKF